MSPLIGFTRFKEKLLDGTKTQTIRKPRKHPIKVGDKLHIYWKLRTKQCEKLGEAIVTKIVRKRVEEFTEEDAIKDGFEKTREGLYLEHSAKRNLLKALIELYWDLKDSDEFDIITFDWIEPTDGNFGYCKQSGTTVYKGEL